MDIRLTVAHRNQRAYVHTLIWTAKEEHRVGRFQNRCSIVMIVATQLNKRLLTDISHRPRALLRNDVALFAPLSEQVQLGYER